MKVCWAQISDFTSDLPAQFALLSSDEQARAASYRVESARTAFIIRRAWLRTMLAGELGTNPTDIRFESGAHGKPNLPNTPLHFSVSHSVDLMLCAISRDIPIGADIEVVRDLAAHHDWISTTAQTVFAPDECAALEACSTHEKRRDLFFKYWTLKEAIVKATGYGLTIDTRRFGVEIAPDGTARIAWSNMDSIPVSGWQITCRTDDVTESYVWAVAYSVGTRYGAFAIDDNAVTVTQLRVPTRDFRLP